MYDVGDSENDDFQVYGDRDIKHLHFKKWATRSLPET